MDDSLYDMQSIHQIFSVDCFNEAWELMDKIHRTPEEDDQMLRLSLTSLWHWSQRADCTPKAMSVGYWQVARIFALLGQADMARRYGLLSLNSALVNRLPPFYLGYAYEALARAEAMSGNAVQAKFYLDKANNASDGVSDEQSKRQLLAELTTITVSRQRLENSTMEKSAQLKTK